MANSMSQDVSRIGFNNNVELGDRALHVQTEVLGRSQHVVRTTVLEAGVVRFADSQPCPADLDSFDDIEEFVRAQHQRHVEKVTRGEVG